MNSVRHALEALITALLVHTHRRHYFDQAAQAFATYRRTVLQPWTLRLQHALQEAERRVARAHDRLHRWQGSPTTRLISDETLLKAVEERFAERYDGPAEVMRALAHPNGLVSDLTRVTLRTLGTFTAEQLCEHIAGHIAVEGHEQRRFLDQGWALPTARSLLTAHLPWLEAGLRPLIDYDRDSLGEGRVRGWLLAPEDLVLTPPFGERLGNLPVRRSADPQCVTVVSFVHGLAPNTLRSLTRCYEAYRRRIGDHRETSDAQHFPLHIFRDAPDYDEPYAPAGWRFDDHGLRELLTLAHMVGLREGHRVQLPVRTFESSVAALKADHNRVIELSRVILDRMRRPRRHASDLVHEKLLHTPALSPLRQTYLAENGLPPMTQREPAAS